MSTTVYARFRISSTWKGTTLESWSPNHCFSPFHTILSGPARLLRSQTSFQECFVRVQNQCLALWSHNQGSGLSSLQVFYCLRRVGFLIEWQGLWLCWFIWNVTRRIWMAVLGIGMATLIAVLIDLRRLLLLHLWLALLAQLVSQFLTQQA